MNKTMVAGSIAAMAFSVALAAQAQARQDFSIQNGIGAPVMRLFISPNDENSWGEDVLGEDILQNGQTANIHFDASVNPQQCLWDIRLDGTGGQQWVVQNVNLCAVSAMVFSRQGNSVVWRAR